MRPPKGRSCPSNKMRYRDRIGALVALGSTGLARSSKREESRVYRCPMCFGWHLTSQPWRKNLQVLCGPCNRRKGASVSDGEDVQ